MVSVAATAFIAGRDSESGGGEVVVAGLIRSLIEGEGSELCDTAGGDSGCEWRCGALMHCVLTRTVGIKAVRLGFGMLRDDIPSSSEACEVIMASISG